MVKGLLITNNNEIKSERSFNLAVYPNPANDKVFIEVFNSNNSSVKIEIMSMDGRILFEKETLNLGVTNVSVDLNEFSSGVYIVRAISDKNSLVQKMVVK